MYSVNVEVSVPYRGLSFYILSPSRYTPKPPCFRPLSGSFFLYYDFELIDEIDAKVSVPYRGLSFYIIMTVSKSLYSKGFRPLSGSFFLY